MKKNKNKFHFKINQFFTLVTVIEIIVTMALIYLLSYFWNIDVSLSPWWIILGSVIISTVITYFANKMILKPIVDLANAMDKVARGDFSLRLKSKSLIGEIRNLYKNFNLMTSELGATETLQSDFVSNVSHEIKTPVNAIEGYATLLQGTESDKENEEYINKILFNTARLSDLVSNILLLSKITNQSIETKKTKYRLDEQIRSAIMLLEPKWLEKNIEFDVELEEASFYGNEGLVFHVWTNIIGNAIKFSPDGGLVTIRLWKSYDRLLITVEDEGEGISENAMNHIFDKFYQADDSHNKDGNGLGLPLAGRIIEMSGGSIEAENRMPAGAKFSVYLPL